MTSHQILTADFLDILFDNRNKGYGAYELRRHYNTRLITSLGGALLLSAFTFLLLNKAHHEKGIAVNGGGYIITELELPKTRLPEPPKLESPKPPAIKQNAFIDNFKAVEKVVVPITPQKDLYNTAIGELTTPGDFKPFEPPYKEPLNVGSTGTSASEPVKEKPKASIPDRSPQFPGGMVAWQAFLNRNLQVPDELQAGEKRTVQIKFNVDEEGNITHFNIVVSGGAAFDNEVIRVLKKMPKWLPAMQGGAPIAVSFTQPVTFVGLEE